MDRTRLNRFVNQPLRDLPLDEPTFVGSNASAREALTQMQEGARSCVLVGQATQLDGILTERDVLTRCMESTFDWAQPVSAIMTAKPVTLSAERTLAEAIAIFRQSSYRTLPVSDGMAIVGLVRIGDVVRHLAEAFPEEVLNLPPRPHQLMEKEEGG